jgi:HTH-type transcriptional regulator / antitoxin HigA
MDELVPAVVFPPGEYLLEILNDRGWSQRDFAEIIGRPAKTVNEIIKGKTSITPTTAKEIAAATDTNPMFWLNLETTYRLHHEADEPSPRIARHALLRSKYPVREMVLRHWIESSSDPVILEGQIKSFFGIESLEEEPRLMHAAKKSGYPDEVNGAQLAWLFRVKQLAEMVSVPEYSEDALRSALATFHELLASADGIRRVPELLKGCGVRFVIVEHVPSSRIDGVCFWLGKDKASPVIGMSLRLDRIDNFWFVLRHEIEHIINGDGKETAMIDSDTGEVVMANQSPEEFRANTAAAAFCVPANAMSDFLSRHGRVISEQHVVNFASRMGVHPGLVAGQIQRRTGDYRRFRKFLVNVRPIVASVALTDGYGQAVRF